MSFTSADDKHSNKRLFAADLLLTKCASYLDPSLCLQLLMSDWLMLFLQAHLMPVMMQHPLQVLAEQKLQRPTSPWKHMPAPANILLGGAAATAAI